jgi:5-methylcytosine-specific restriction endonuclease McrA
MSVVTFKVCRICGISGEQSLFHAQRKQATRRTKYGTCLPCYREKVRQDNENRKEQRAEWDKRNRKNKYLKNLAKPHYKELRKQEYRRNKASYVTRAYNRYLKRKEQTLPTVKYADMQFIYTEAQQKTQNEGVVYNVDHIVPLVHRSICGLNVPWNMQIIVESENKRKSNKWDGTYDNKGWSDVQR